MGAWQSIKKVAKVIVTGRPPHTLESVTDRLVDSGLENDGQFGPGQREFLGDLQYRLKHAKKDDNFRAR